MATYYGEDGTAIPMFPLQGTHFANSELHHLCDGTIDLIDMGDEGVFVVNEDAYAIGLPKNDEATALALPYLPDGTYIAGPALHTTLGEISNPITLAKLSQLHARRSSE